LVLYIPSYLVCISDFDTRVVLDVDRGINIHIEA